MRSILFVCLALGLALGAPARADDVVRIACVGDSITEGTANADHRRNSWPQILGRLFEAMRPAGAFEIGNFGRSGATLLAGGRRPYRDQDVYAASRAFAPNVVIINLGTNDTVPATWTAHGAGFERELRALIDDYRTLESAPEIWLSTLTPVFEPHPADRAPARAAIEQTIAAVATELGLPVIDFTTPLADRSDLFPDGLHPNTAANERMAQAAFSGMLGIAAPIDPSLRPRPLGGPALTMSLGGETSDADLGGWTANDHWVEGSGAGNVLRARYGLDEGDFHIRTRLRMLGQENSAAQFHLDGNVFGFEGARGTVFRNGPQMGGLRLLHRSEQRWTRDAWIDFEAIRNGDTVWFLVNGRIEDMALIPGPIESFGFDPMRSTMQIASWSVDGTPGRPAAVRRRSVEVPWVDLAHRADLRHEEEGIAVVTPAFFISPERRKVYLSKETIAGTDVPALRTVPDHAALPDEYELRVLSDGTLFPGAVLGPASFLWNTDGSIFLAAWSETSGQYNTLAAISRDKGATWTPVFEMPAWLTGSHHRRIKLADGRFLVGFRDEHPSSPTCGDYVAWIGTEEDLFAQRPGGYTCRFLRATEMVDPAAVLVVGGNGRPLRVRCPHERVHGAQETPRTVVTTSIEELDALVPKRGYDVPLIDFNDDADRFVVVDREPGQYLGHVSTTLLEDGRTILATYPKGHGRGAIVYKRSTDGGRTWSERLPTPPNWATSREVPTIHRVLDPEGVERLILWSGLYPARRAVSEDNGATWSELEIVGDWGGIVVMGFVEQLRDGRCLAMFHDDGRFFTDTSQRTSPPVFTLYQTISDDGGLTWSHPTTVWSGGDVHLCEPGCVRSPDGSTLAVLLRENRRVRNSSVIFSQDEGKTWSAPRELPAALTGDRHTAKYAPDGRLFICFRDTAHESPTQGDWVGWVGTWDDIRDGTPGQYRIRFKDNKHRWDTTYPGVECLPDGTFVVTTYGHWEEGEEPYILSVRFTLGEVDARAAGR